MSEDKDDTKPMVKAGLKAYEQNIAKGKLLEQIVSDATRQGDLNLAAQIGMFVVYVQQLEQTLKRIIGITVGFKSYFNNNGYSVMYKTDSITRDSDSLGTLVKIVKTINIRDESTHAQVLDSFVSKLEGFVSKRNNYIHRLLNDPGIDDLAKLKTALINANLELIDLNKEADEKLGILYKLFELDGLPYTFARHVISSEKYGPKPKDSPSK